MTTQEGIHTAVIRKIFERDIAGFGLDMQRLCLVDIVISMILNHRDFSGRDTYEVVDQLVAEFDYFYTDYYGPPSFDSYWEGAAHLHDEVANRDFYLHEIPRFIENLEQCDDFAQYARDCDEQARDEGIRGRK